MDLSIVLPAHNEERYLGAQLESLINQEWSGEWEIIVVDNNSADGTAALVEQFAHRSHRVRLLRAAEQNDKSYAVAEGVAAATADNLAFCDADDIVAPGWVAAIAAGLQQHQVVTGPNELDLLNPPWLGNSRGRSGDAPVGTFARLFPCIRGNNYGLRRAVWQSIGPLSAGFYPVEDLEYSYRCWANGIEVVGLPGAIVHYRYRASASALYRQGWRYGVGRVRITRLLRDEGKPRPPRFGGWRSWVMLVYKVPTLASRNGRANWLWIAGNRLGQLAGSIRYRTLML